MFKTYAGLRNLLRQNGRKYSTAPNNSQKFVNQASNVLKSVTRSLEKALGGYKEPVFYNAAVTKEILKQVYQAEKLAPPSSFSQVLSTWGQIVQRASQRQTYQRLVETGEWAKVGIIGLEAYVSINHIFDNYRLTKIFIGYL